MPKVLELIGVPKVLELIEKEELAKALSHDETFLRLLARQLDATSLARLQCSET